MIKSLLVSLTASPSMRRAGFSPKIYQRGQASVFVLALMGVVLLCSIFLYQSGKITSEKMQLQNAADAAAYGSSVLEARALNFAAYTNRAMVANEVGIGQLVGVLSWIDEIKTTGQYLDAYGQALGTLASVVTPIPVVGWIGGNILQALSRGLEAVGQAIERGADVVLRVLDPAVYAFVFFISQAVQRIYSISQFVYHFGTMVAVTTNVLKCLDDNVPGTSHKLKDLFNKDSKDQGAQLSPLGILALAGHMPSYLYGHTKLYASKIKNPFKKKPKEGDKKDQDPQEDKKGMGRFAGTVREARDPYTSGGDPITETTKIFGQDVTTRFDNRSWRFGLGTPRVHFNFDSGIPAPLETYMKGDLEFFMGLASKGGSELRYKKKAYVWSAVDTLIGGPTLTVPSIKLAGVTVLSGGPYSLGLPLGGGSYQAPGSKDNALTILDGVAPDITDAKTLTNFKMLLKLAKDPYFFPFLPKKEDPKVYGGAGADIGRLVPWVTAWMGITGNKLGHTFGASSVPAYSGLQAYRDMGKVKKGKEEEPKVPPENIASQFPIPFQSPFFLVCATRKMKEGITDKGPQFSGNLDLINDDDNKIVDRVGVIARSEVYFSRPRDLSYFLRKDKNTEKPNVFSPFWQARLAETSDFDRFLALALQQHTIWLSGEVQQNIPFLSEIVTESEKVLQFLEALFDSIP